MGKDDILDVVLQFYESKERGTRKREREQRTIKQFKSFRELTRIRVVRGMFNDLWNVYYILATTQQPILLQFPNI